MLETVFLMVIAGCSEDMTLCEQLAAPPMPYASNEDCLMALSGAVMQVRSLWPVTRGDCLRQAVGAAESQLLASIGLTGAS